MKPEIDEDERHPRGDDVTTGDVERRHRFVVRRIYEPAGHDELRVLVDRLWPRGVSKAAAALDDWAKDAAPSTELRRWYGHRPERFAAFARRYRDELRHSPADAVVARLLEAVATSDVALLTATKDIDHSGARVLLDHLEDMRRHDR